MTKQRNTKPERLQVKRHKGPSGKDQRGSKQPGGYWEQEPQVSLTKRGSMWWCDMQRVKHQRWQQLWKRKKLNEKRQPPLIGADLERLVVEQKCQLCVLRATDLLWRKQLFLLGRKHGGVIVNATAAFNLSDHTHSNVLLCFIFIFVHVLLLHPTITTRTYCVTATAFLYTSIKSEPSPCLCSVFIDCEDPTMIDRQHSHRD